jgi:MazG family protein
MGRAAESIERLQDIMARLRGPDGCPWDREQDLKTLRPYLLEEAYEVLEAIDSGDTREHCEELGDLLLQIVFHAQLAREKGQWELADVADAISEKLVRRHPHVFGDAVVKDAEGVMKQWVELKKEEKKAKGGGKSVLEGVPRELPALARAERLTEKASRIGFDWPSIAGAREKVTEELGELDEALAKGDRAAVEDELGDVFFALVNLARHAKVPPEEALRGTIGRFISRFHFVEAELERRGVAHGKATLEEMDALWIEAKAKGPSRS